MAKCRLCKIHHTSIVRPALYECGKRARDSIFVQSFFSPNYTDNSAHYGSIHPAVAFAIKNGLHKKENEQTPSFLTSVRINVKNRRETIVHFKYIYGLIHR